METRSPLPSRQPSQEWSKETFLDALSLVAASDARVRAVWLEADDARSLRRPYGEVTVHAAADEPDFLPLVAAWEGILAGLADTARPVWTDTVRNARQLEIDASGRTGKAERLRFVIECSAFLAKRRRRAVVALVDKTHHLLHVMDFSRAQSGR